MKISYNQATAMNCSNTEKDLILCENAGFEYIELRIDMLKDYLKNHSIKELKDFFGTSRLKPHAFNAIYLYPEFLTENDDIVRQANLMADFMLCCKAGHEIGSHYIVIVPFLREGDPSLPYEGIFENTHEQSVRILKKLGKIAKEYDMKLCFEVVGLNKSSVKSVEQAKEIVESVNESNVGYVFDIYNLYLNTLSNDYSQMKLVEKEKIFAVHVNNADDVPVQLMGQHNRRFVDEGCLDLKAFYKVLKELNYNSIISIETFRPEYWEKDAEWVIQNSYNTTFKSIENI